MSLSFAMRRLAEGQVKSLLCTAGVSGCIHSRVPPTYSPQARRLALANRAPPLCDSPTCQGSLAAACSCTFYAVSRANRAMQVYLALYTAESYPRTARKLGVWPFPRGHHHFVTRLPVKGALLLLADQRFCPLLPEQHRLKPKPGLTAVAAAQHQSCLAACR